MQVAEQSLQHQVALASQLRYHRSLGVASTRYVFEDEDAHRTALKLIPVIDLMRGRVVRARGGRRDDYRPLISRLCPDAEPVALAARFRNALGADTLYVADLDAIMGHGDNRALLQSIALAQPSLELWVDAGLGDRDTLSAFRAAGTGRPVIGSETLSDAQLPDSDPDALLSLDFSGDTLLGPAALLPTIETERRDLILMSLHRIGGDCGPDLALLRDLRLRLPQCRLHVAGGVRNAGDLRHLADAGASGVLLSSALHDGRICAADTVALGD
jgi:phosphoribosylformimino-5-aminoimidazole carboxamide ribotide isomerase